MHGELLLPAALKDFTTKDKGSHKEHKVKTSTTEDAEVHRGTPVKLQPPTLTRYPAT
jgi:hypothetical protein